MQALKKGLQVPLVLGRELDLLALHENFVVAAMEGVCLFIEEVVVGEEER